MYLPVPGSPEAGFCVIKKQDRNHEWERSHFQARAVQDRDRWGLIAVTRGIVLMLCAVGMSTALAFERIDGLIPAGEGELTSALTGEKKTDDPEHPGYAGTPTGGSIPVQAAMGVIPGESLADSARAAPVKRIGLSIMSTIRANAVPLTGTYPLESSCVRSRIVAELVPPLTPTSFPTHGQSTTCRTRHSWVLPGHGRFHLATGGAIDISITTMLKPFVLCEISKGFIP